jgi:hypothetical protein
MTTEREFRKELSEFGIGLEIIEFKSHDRANLYPTRSKHIHKMTLELRRHLADTDLEGLMKYSLSDADFKLWQSSKQTALLDIVKEGSAKQ